MMLLAAPGKSNPALADFQAVNAKIAPRQLDPLMFFQSAPTEPSGIRRTRHGRDSSARACT